MGSSSVEWRDEPPRVLVRPEAIRSLDRRGEYFDRRSGDVWDLFFPGYHHGDEREREADGRPAGRQHLRDWHFHPRDFDLFRREVEGFAEGRWEYSGGTDLVLVSGWMPVVGRPTVDWSTTMSGSLTDSATGNVTLSLPEVLERVTRDLERATDSADLGVAPVVAPTEDQADRQPMNAVARDIVTNALGGVLAALGAKAFGA